MSDIKVFIWHRTPTGEVRQTAGKWKASGTLAENVAKYAKSLSPGGENAYVSEYLGYTPKPVKAVLMDGEKEVERWAAAH